MPKSKKEKIKAPFGVKLISIFSLIYSLFFITALLNASLEIIYSGDIGLFFYMVWGILTLVFIGSLIISIGIWRGNSLARIFGIVLSSFLLFSSIMSINSMILSGELNEFTSLIDESISALIIIILFFSVFFFVFPLYTILYLLISKKSKEYFNSI